MICKNCMYGCHHDSMAAAAEVRALPGIRESGVLNLLMIIALGLAAWGIAIVAIAFLFRIFT